MDDPFFRSYWNTPFNPVYRKGPSSRGYPDHDVSTATPPGVVTFQPKPRVQPAESSKVVTIPVQYVKSKPKLSESDSALRIQKVFRGCRVRKNVKKIEEVRKEVEEKWRNITGKEMVDLMRRDSRERLRVNEMLMRLLLRLDSVNGFDVGVRDLRKTVIRKIIALQEALDAILDAKDTSAEETTQCQIPN